MSNNWPTELNIEYLYNNKWSDYIPINIKNIYTNNNNNNINNTDNNNNINNTDNNNINNNNNNNLNNDIETIHINKSNDYLLYQIKFIDKILYPNHPAHEQYGLFAKTNILPSI